MPIFDDTAPASLVAGSAPAPPFADTPILASLIVDLGERRRLAATNADRLRRRLADVEAMHEPDADRECPTCRMPSPCPTLRLTRGEIDYEAACAAVRGLIDLTAVEQTRPDLPHVPKLRDLLASPSEGIDRFFDVLLGVPPTEPLSEEPSGSHRQA